jgi:hypothetical protein
MRTRIEDGGPAFPRPVSEDRTQGDQPDGNKTVDDQEGMTLRDYFAAKAMSAEVSTGGLDGRDVEHTAGMAYEMADAMIAMRDRKGGQHGS